MAVVLVTAFTTGTVIGAVGLGVHQFMATRMSLQHLLRTRERPVPIIQQARTAGKEVHVWTLNQTGEMLLMIERGANNLITDHPDVAVRLLRERAELSDAEKLALSLRALFGKEEAAPGGAQLSASSQ